MAALVTNDSMLASDFIIYINTLGHLVNIGVSFGLRGRVLTTSHTCASGSQGIGFAYKTNQYGHQLVMLTSGSTP